MHAVPAVTMAIGGHARGRRGDREGREHRAGEAEGGEGADEAGKSTCRRDSRHFGVSLAAWPT